MGAACSSSSRQVAPARGPTTVSERYKKEIDDGFPTLGITLAGIRSFVASQGGEAAFAGKTTTEVCEGILKPATAVTGTSFCVQEKHRGHAAAAGIGVASIFVSHAWKYRFLDVVAALEHWQQRKCPSESPPVFWFDLFSNGQHGTSSRPFTWWTGCFRDNIRRLGHTLLVLQWAAPIPLTRMWCVWELASTASTGARLEVAMSPTEERAFLAALEAEYDTLVHKTCRVDVETAEAYNTADRERIREAVRASVGFQDTNKLVIGQMREWMASAGMAALVTLPPLERAASRLQWNLARLLREQGRLEDAEPLYREALENCQRTRLQADPLALAAANNLAVLLSERGKLSEAEILLRETLAGRRAALGCTHSDTLDTANNLANLLAELGGLKEAAGLHAEALAGRRVACGPAHVSTLASAAALGTVLQSLGQEDEADPLLREALAGRQAALGPSHPETLSSTNSLAVLMVSRGRLTEAEPLFRDALAARRRTQGDAHPATLSAIVNLAACLQDQLKSSSLAPSDRAALQHAASELFTEALHRSRAALGDEHVATLHAAAAMAAFLEVKAAGLSADGRDVEGSSESAAEQRLQLLAQAQALHREALAGRRAALGPKHPDTLHSAHRLGGLLLAQGETGAAESLLREALAGRLAVLGPAHADTLLSLAELVAMLHTSGRHLDAVEAHRATLGENHVATLTAMNDMALLIRSHQLGATSDCSSVAAHANASAASTSEALLRGALHGRRALLGSKHKDTLATAANLANALCDSGDLEGAEALYAEVYEGLAAADGAEHPRLEAIAGILTDLRLLLASGMAT